MYRGFICLWRKLKDDPVWTCSSAPQKVILITILLMTSHKKNEWVWKGHKFNVEPGQMITSIESIRVAAGKGISTRQVRTALEKFSRLEFLTIETTNTNSLITVNNWITYQSHDKPIDKPIDKQVTNDRQTIDKRLTTINNDNHDNNGNNDSDKPCGSSETPPPPAPIPDPPPPPTDKPKRQAKEPAGEHNQTIRYYTDEYEKKMGTKYPFHSGKDGVAMKNLISHYSPEKVRNMIDLFLADNDPFYKKSGKTISMLWSKAAVYAPKTGSTDGGRDDVDYDELGKPAHLRRDANEM
jgi:hypothetical protein